MVIGFVLVLAGSLVATLAATGSTRPETTVAGHRGRSGQVFSQALRPTASS
jgi:hypothetical protein